MRAPVQVPGRIQRRYAFGVRGRSAAGYSFSERAARFVQEMRASTRRAPL